MSPILFSLASLVLQAPTAAAQPLAGGRPDALCGPGKLVVPAYQGKVDLASYLDCNATLSGVAGPWSGRLSPEGDELFVTLSGLVGSFGTENCLVVRVDADTDQATGSSSVGLFPEEIAWTTAGGQTLAGYVSNSSSGSVSVLDATGQVQQTIALPDPLGFGSCFPFGLAVSPDQSRVYVGTLDGSGNVYAIDTTLQTVETAETLHIPGGHGRLAFYRRSLIVPVTEYDPFFTSSTAKLVFVEPADEGGAVTIPIPSSATFPSAQDVAIRCDGRVFLAGIDLEAKIHVFDAVTRSYLHAIPTPTAGFHQGLTVSSRGQLAVADYVSEEIVFVNSWTEQVLSTVDLALLPDAHLDPEELLFSRNGMKLWAVCNGSASLAVFETP